MKFLDFEYEHSRVDKKEIGNTANKLLPEIDRIAEALECATYDSPYASLKVPFDSDMLKSTLDCVAQKKEYNPVSLVLIGIGGSQLGLLAVHEALNGLFYNQKSSTVKFFSADTVDAHKMKEIVTFVKTELESNKKVIINIVSKSGTTLETAVNAAEFLQLLRTHFPDEYRKYIVITTDSSTPLELFAQKEKINFLTIPSLVGGRFSVFSPAGIFGLAMLGIDVQSLLEGARSAVEWCLSKNIEENPAAMNAILKYDHYKRNVIIHDLFVFSPELESVGKWYRQLVGESLGKEYDKQNKHVNVGIIPTVSVGTNDLHSVAQLYLGGPRVIFTTFVSVMDDEYDINTEVLQELGLNMRVHDKQVKIPLMNTILNGVKSAYVKDKRAYCSLQLPTLSPFYIGQLLQMYMIEIMYLGYLLNISPFDQPNVQHYKREVNLLLSNLLS